MSRYEVYPVNDINDPVLDKIKGLYLSSFPEEERRQWQSIIDMIDNSSPFFFLKAILSPDGEFMGFYSSWNLPGVLYIEHFAIEPRFRSTGIGSSVITDVVAGAMPRSVVVEVELPGSSSDADRRISFYERNGFSAVGDLQYFQPPYRPGLDMVEMMLMTSQPLPDVKTFVIMLHTLVYNQ
ncbi:MAG: GNAT family N-acetyltransferase [Muribaculaceae bacterium]|nr:GNAT family N-acetyltransferase [Muribaculaceae bacterium]